MMPENPFNPEVVAPGAIIAKSIEVEYFKFVRIFIFLCPERAKL